MGRFTTNRRRATVAKPRQTGDDAADRRVTPPWRPCVLRDTSPQLSGAGRGDAEIILIVRGRRRWCLSGTEARGCQPRQRGNQRGHHRAAANHLCRARHYLMPARAACRFDVKFGGREPIPSVVRGAFDASGRTADAAIETPCTPPTWRVSPIVLELRIAGISVTAHRPTNAGPRRP